MIFEITLTIIVVLGFILLACIINSRLKALKVEPDTKMYGDIRSKLSELGTTVEQTARNQEKKDEQREDRAKKFQEDFVTFIRMMGGTKERGKIGENMLKETLNPFIKSGRVIKNLNIDNKVVEFAWKVSPNKYIPIDSKLPDVLGLYKEYSESKSKEEQLKLKKTILEKVKKRITDAKKYRNKRNTTNKVIIAIPDAIFDIIPEINSEAQKTNILVAGYRLVVYLASYIEREYQIIIESGDVGVYQESIGSILRLVGEIKDKTKTIDKGVVMIKKANDDIKESSIEAESKKVKKKIVVEVKK